MKRLMTVIVATAGIAVGLVIAQDSATSSAAQMAEQFAKCMRTLDAECVIRLSDVDRYNRLGSPGGDYVLAQKHAFERFREIGKTYERFDTESPWPEFSAQGISYVFIPYVAQLSGLPEVRAYLVGVSDNAGRSWKFVDGAHITPANIQRIIPGYGGQPLPESIVP